MVSASLEVLLRRVEANRNEKEGRVGVQPELGDGPMPMGRILNWYPPDDDVERITVQSRQGQSYIGDVLDITARDRHAGCDRRVVSLIGLN
ncbi:MAG TPA: hypothetical protein VGG90_01205 [Candidatus Dormibacteraeota bacterium]